MFLCLSIQSADNQTRVHRRSAEHIQGVFSEKSSDFIFIDALKAQLFFPFFFKKSPQKTKTVSQTVDQSVGQWRRDLISTSFGMSPSSPVRGTQMARGSSDQSKELSVWPTAARSHRPFIRQPQRHQQPGSACAQRQSGHIFNKWLTHL